MMLTWVWLNDVNNDNSVAQMRNAKVQNVREFYTANKYFLRKLFFFFLDTLKSNLKWALPVPS